MYVREGGSASKVPYGGDMAKWGGGKAKCVIICIRGGVLCIKGWMRQRRNGPPFSTEQIHRKRRVRLKLGYKIRGNKRGSTKDWENPPERREGK
jgi:hypothetical protein